MRTLRPCQSHISPRGTYDRQNFFFGPLLEQGKSQPSAFCLVLVALVRSLACSCLLSIPSVSCCISCTMLHVTAEWRVECRAEAGACVSFVVVSMASTYWRDFGSLRSKKSLESQRQTPTFFDFMNCII